MSDLTDFRSDQHESVNERVRARLSEERLEQLDRIRSDAYGRPVLCFTVRSLLDEDDVPLHTVDEWHAPIRERTGLYSSQTTGKYVQEFTLHSEIDDEPPKALRDDPHFRPKG
jgi:hypothetical protein